MRVIVRRERPHPGAQVWLTDADGHRLTAFATNTASGGPHRQLADLQLRHRRRAHAEDRIRAAKDTGLANLPLHQLAQNRIWCAIVALACELAVARRGPRRRGPAAELEVQRDLLADVTQALGDEPRVAPRSVGSAGGAGRVHVRAVDARGPVEGAARRRGARREERRWRWSTARSRPPSDNRLQRGDSDLLRHALGCGDLKGDLMPFETSPCVTMAGTGRWRLTEPLAYKGARDQFVVPAGFVTDFATIPGFLLWLIPRDGLHTMSAILHDWACTEGIHSGVVSPRDADGLFRRCLREAKVPLIRRWLLWAGVRAGAMANPLRRPGSLHDLPAVAAIALLAAPIVAPPALLAVLAYAVYGVVELAAAVIAPGEKP
jgi:Protein of unknown function (DUF1353)/Transposase DDE domain group 1